jgi:hypothetical protein
MVKSNKSSVNSRSNSQQIPCRLWKEYYHIRKTCHQSFPERGEYSSHIYAPFFKGTFNMILLLRVGIKSNFFRSGLQIKILCGFLIYTIHATCHSHIILA